MAPPLASARPPVPTLGDGTVTLRAHTEDDVEALVEQCVDPLTRRWTTVPLAYGRDDARRFVREIMPGAWEHGTEWGFAAEIEGRYAATVVLRDEGDSRAEIAFASHPWVRGTGGVHRALTLLLDWGFAERGLTTVVWLANVGNWGSRKAAWRLGFTMEGTVRRHLVQRGELRDAWIATLLREDSREPTTRWLDTPVLGGDRVVLRPPQETDVPRIVEACSDELTQRWLGQLPAPYAVPDALAWLEACREGAASGGKVTWAVADPDDDRFLGSMGFFDIEPDCGGELGYLTHPDARGRGLTTEAALLASRYALGPLGLPQLRASAAVGNATSRGVLERVGFLAWGTERRAARLRTGPASAMRYELTPAELA